MDRGIKTSCSASWLLFNIMAQFPLPFLSLLGLRKKLEECTLILVFLSAFLTQLMNFHQALFGFFSCQRGDRNDKHKPNVETLTTAQVQKMLQLYCSMTGALKILEQLQTNHWLNVSL